MQRLKIIFPAFCFLLLSATLAIASEEHEESWSNLAFRIVNIILFVGVIYYFFGKKIVGFFKGRTEGIASEIATLEQRKDEALKNLADVEKSIANLEEERKAILAEYSAQGEALKASIIEQAEKAALQIAAQAKSTAENEIKTAVEAMRAEMADKVVEATEKLLVKKLSASEHTKLVDKYLTKVVLN
ncbi:ATP synthase F0 subunit B [Desulfovibrio sp. OttesenSCG-928-A18]|nr:ATP synthase F0 subunit B [Desulfovibrio sp. OttesenSCG-928-A18]